MGAGGGTLPDHAGWVALIQDASEEDRLFSRNLARERAQARFGRQVFFSRDHRVYELLQNDCYYCGIRRSNRELSRYRLTEDEILTCCEEGYKLGYRTFVLQGGEDGWWTDEKITALVRKIRAAYPDCAITLSIGEKIAAGVSGVFDAGADRYLLRHETADCAHYGKLHPPAQTLENRIRCLFDLKGNRLPDRRRHDDRSALSDGGYAGKRLCVFSEAAAADGRHGPVSAASGYAVSGVSTGSAEQTLYLLSLVRLMLRTRSFQRRQRLGRWMEEVGRRAFFPGATW